MVARQVGTYAVQITLALTPQHRRRLEYAVRSRRILPSEYVSAALADLPPRLADPATAVQRSDTVPLLVYLLPEQRVAFEQFAHAHDTSIGALVSELLAGAMQELPDPPVAQQSDHQAELLRSYRQEQRRLRALLDRDSPERPPAWLVQYVQDLEAEIRRLELRAAQRPNRPA